MPRRAPRALRATAPDRRSGPAPSPYPLTVRIRLRGETVIWSDLMYPGPDGTTVEEVRFHLEQYLGEIERAYAASELHEAVVRPPGPIRIAPDPSLPRR
ncbi:hypothetical protein ACWGCK_01265 [Streptomyces virginiae]